MRKLFLLTLTVLLTYGISSAQRWKRQRVEYSFGLGASNFLGDLGGRDQVGSDFIQDYEWAATRYAASLGYRYQIANDWYVKGNFVYALVSGDDDLTEEPARARRQLNFKSNIFELSAQLEYMLVKQKNWSFVPVKGG